MEIIPFVMVGFFGLFWLFISVIWLGVFCISILGTVFWVFMLIDIVKRDFPKQDEKTMWVVIVALTGVVGAAIYYFMIKAKDNNR